MPVPQDEYVASPERGEDFENIGSRNSSARIRTPLSAQMFNGNVTEELEVQNTASTRDQVSAAMEDPFFRQGEWPVADDDDVSSSGASSEYVDMDAFEEMGQDSSVSSFDDDDGSSSEEDNIVYGMLSRVFS